MKRRLAIWMYLRALKMEPLIAVGVQMAADENAERRLVRALAEAQQKDAEAERLERHQANVARIASSN